MPSSTASRILDVTIPSACPRRRSPASIASTPGYGRRRSPWRRAVVLAVHRDELVDARPERARPSAPGAASPTPAMSTSSGGTHAEHRPGRVPERSRMSATESTSVPSKSNSHVSGARGVCAREQPVTAANPTAAWKRRTSHEKPTPRGRRRRPHPRPGRMRQLVLLAGLVHQTSTPGPAEAAPVLDVNACAGRKDHRGQPRRISRSRSPAATTSRRPAPTRSSSPTRARRRTT